MEVYKTMKLTIFSKSLRSKEGKPFKVYLSRLRNNKTGEEVTCRVNFPEGTAIPPTFPVIVTVDKQNANLSERKYTDESGQTHTTYTLWVKAYTLTGEEYVDHSLDDFE
jgi:hypothetical protein